MTNIEKYHYDKNYFKLYSKNKLLKKMLLLDNQEYKNFLLKYKKSYLELLSKKIQFVDIVTYLKKDKQYTLNNDKKAKLYYLFFIINNIPVAITKLLTIKLQNKFFTPIITYLNCKYEDIVYLYNTFVLDDFRGKNINKLFIKYIVKSINKKYIIVVIANNNKLSVISHLKTGFIKTNITAFNEDNLFYYKSIN